MTRNVLTPPREETLEQLAPAVIATNKNEKSHLTRRGKIAKAATAVIMTGLAARGAVAVAGDINTFATDHFGTEYGQGELAHNYPQVKVPLTPGQNGAQGEGITAAIESVDPKLASDGQGLSDVTDYVDNKLAKAGESPLTATSITVPRIAEQQAQSPGGYHNTGVGPNGSVQQFTPHQ